LIALQLLVGDPRLGRTHVGRVSYTVRVLESHRATTDVVLIAQRMEHGMDRARPMGRPMRRALRRGWAARSYARYPARLVPRVLGRPRAVFEFGREGRNRVWEEVVQSGPSDAGSFIITVRSLRFRTVHLRRGTSDATVAWDTFVGRYHLPPRPMYEPCVVWDLGANVGLTAAHYAARFPAAVIYAVEPDAATVSQAHLNTRAWSDRVTLIHGAVWSADGAIGFSSDPRMASGAHVDFASDIKVKAYSLNSLLAGMQSVDFMKMDVEGAETELLTRHTEWAGKVRVLKVEVHSPYTPARCCNDLAALGFSARRYGRHANMVIARRRTSG
jgi:FkbM family methyltransferase